MSNRYPIIYVRGYAGTQGDVEETVDDPFYGFNLGSTHIRMDEQGLAEFYAFESPFVRLMTEHGYNDVFNGVLPAISPDFVNPSQTIWIYRYYDPTSKTYDRPGTPGVKPGTPAPKDFVPDVVPTAAFDVDRIFCIVGTNARDYDAAGGLSRTAVGPQSDGLVQIEAASVHAAPRAYIYRSHSGRYGMVNSEEGYQNLRRFLFGDVRVEMVLCDFDLDFSANSDSVQVTYQLEAQVAIRNSLILMHERSRMHYCPIGLNQEQWVAQRQKGLPLYTSFLLGKLAKDGTLRYMVRLAVYQQKFEHGFLSIRDHIERLPVWSDYLIVELRAVDPPGMPWNAFYSWASDSREPQTAVEIVDVAADEVDALVRLPAKGQAALGPEAKVRFRTYWWA